jgi:hypothetical protein
MDVEGHEFAALKGRKATLSSPMCAAPFCEIHLSMLPSDVSATQIIELIESFGFWEISATTRSGEVQVVALKEHDAENSPKRIGGNGVLA